MQGNWAPSGGFQGTEKHVRASLCLIFPPREQTFYFFQFFFLAMLLLTHFHVCCFCCCAAGSINSGRWGLIRNFFKNPWPEGAPNLFCEHVEKLRPFLTKIWIFFTVCTGNKFGDFWWSSPKCHLQILWRLRRKLFLTVRTRAEDQYVPHFDLSPHSDHHSFISVLSFRGFYVALLSHSHAGVFHHCSPFWFHPLLLISLVTHNLLLQMRVYVQVRTCSLDLS